MTDEKTYRGRKFAMSLRGMRIAFSGAGGTGKGSVANAITRNFAIKFLPSTIQDSGLLLFPDTKNYREIREMPSLDRWIYQYSILMSQIQAERLAADSVIGYVSERSLFDFAAYVRDAPKEEYSKYLAFLLRAYERNPYDTIFYVPTGSFDPSDKNTTGKWKERDEKERRETDSYLRDVLKKYATRSKIVILRGDFEERKSIAIREIDEWRHHTSLNGSAIPTSPLTRLHTA